MNSIQIVLDTNVLYAGLVSRRGASFELLKHLETGRSELNLSVPLVLEYEEVLLRKEPILNFTPEEMKTTTR